MPLTLLQQKALVAMRRRGLRPARSAGTNAYVWAAREGLNPAFNPSVMEPGELIEQYTNAQCLELIRICAESKYSMIFIYDEEHHDPE